jgi:hypothetical protein
MIYGGSKVVDDTFAAAYCDHVAPQPVNDGVPVTASQIPERSMK